MKNHWLFLFSKRGGQMSKIYTTVSGDTWDLISYKVFGTETYMDKIIKLNIDYINTVVFKAGIAINLPDKLSTADDKLPPWKK